MAQNIRDQNPEVIWQLPAGMRLGGAVAAPSPCVPFPCAHICVGRLECCHLAGKSIEKHFCQAEWLQ